MVCAEGKDIVLCNLNLIINMTCCKGLEMGVRARVSFALLQRVAASLHRRRRFSSSAHLPTTCIGSEGGLVV